MLAGWCPLGSSPAAFLNSRPGRTLPFSLAHRIRRLSSVRTYVGRWLFGEYDSARPSTWNAPSCGIRRQQGRGCSAQLVARAVQLGMRKGVHACNLLQCLAARRPPWPHLTRQLGYPLNCLPTTCTHPAAAASHGWPHPCVPRRVINQVVGDDDVAAWYVDLHAGGCGS